MTVQFSMKSDTQSFEYRNEVEFLKGSSLVSYKRCFNDKIDRSYTGTLLANCLSLPAACACPCVGAWIEAFDGIQVDIEVG